MKLRGRRNQVRAIEFLDGAGEPFLRRGVFDQLAKTIAILFEAPMVIIGISNRRHFGVLGGDGIDWALLPADWSLGFLAPGITPLTFVRNLARDRRFANHPIRAVLPTAKQLLYAPFSVQREGTSGGIAIIDSRLSWPLSPRRSRTLRESAHVCALLLDELEGRDTVGRPKGFEEAAATADLDRPDPVTDFLARTLVSRMRWHPGGAFGYSTVRSWSQSIKSHQIDAFVALKASPTNRFIDLMADEIATVSNKLVGRRNISMVVNVPCGHSKTAHCVSEMLAQRVASRLGIEAVEAFERQRRSGTSHPRTNASLPPFKQKMRARGTVLIVDDMATTGRHLIQAATAIAPAADHVTAIAWIGAR